MVTDLAEVRRLGTEKSAENVDFRRYLSAHHAGETAFQILAGEVRQQVDCTACANCCRESIVALTEAEIETIAGHLGIAPGTAAHFYTDPDPDGAARRILRNEDGACVFLDGNLCLIYEVRPKTCRDFPHLGIGIHSLGSRPSSHARWAPLCPIIYNALEAYKHLTGFDRRNH